MSNPMSKQDEIKCACVHTDAYECARIRDGRHLPGDDDYYKRACECCCHDDEDYEDDWDDDWANPTKRT